MTRLDITQINKPLSEHQESVILANWLRSKGVLFTKTTQETFTRSWNQKRKNKLEGLAKGLPDYIILGKDLIFVELKKAKGKRGGSNGSVTSPEQIEWIESLNNYDNVRANICYGADDAIDFINKYI